jgi:ribosomal protein L11 methyltransferase
VGWLLRFSCETELAAELMTSRLWDVGTTGVFEGPDGELVAGFETEAEATDAARQMASADGVRSNTMSVDPIADQSTWAVNNTPEQITVQSGGQRFSIAITAEATFGHGAHPTTQLSLDLLMAALRPGCELLDVGTGSGVLAIAAAKAGAGSVTAIDIDPDAVPVAIRNAEANGVAINVTTATIAEIMSERTTGFDVIVANVLLPVHRELSPDVLRSLNPGGSLVTAGYLADQAEALCGMYTEGGEGADGVRLTVVDDAANGDWRAHRFTVAG